MSTPYIGEIRVFGFNFPPYGWAFCNGQAMSISQYTALFSVIGTVYGGNGQTTFNLPNLQGSAAMHWGNGAGLSPRTIGEVTGTTTVTVTTNEIPLHTHMLTAAKAGAATQEQTTPSVNVWIGNSVPGQAFSDTTAALGAQFSMSGVGNNGGSQPHNNLQPLLTMNFCIALNGIFPSRN